MTARAWSCDSCGALVQPDEDACHRCGTLRYNEPPTPGTPAEFVTLVHRTAVGHTPPPRGPIPDTLPTDTELVSKAKSNGTIPGAPIEVPPPIVRREVPESEPERKRSWAWLWLVAIPLVLGGGGYAAYWFIEPLQDYVDGVIDAVRQ